MHRYAFASLFCLSLCFLATPVFGARYVPIKIYLAGELILEGNASDNGHPDADEVWNALKQVNLGETELFAELFGKDVGNELEIRGKREGEVPQGIKVQVAYGGVAEVTALRLVRKPADRAGRVWRIHSDDVSDMFNSRLIRRSDAARLSNPGREE